MSCISMLYSSILHNTKEMEPARCPSTEEKTKKGGLSTQQNFMQPFKNKIIRMGRNGNHCGELSNQIQRDKVSYVFPHTWILPLITKHPSFALVKKSENSGEGNPVSSQQGWLGGYSGPSPGASRGHAAGSTGPRADVLSQYKEGPLGDLQTPWPLFTSIPHSEVE